MSMDEDDRDGFAAEYVLGTLDTDERAQADALMLVDTGFAASVKRWERRLGELTALVAPVEPPAPLWERIKAGLTDTGQTADLHLPEAPAPPLRADTSRADAPTADIFHMRQRMQRWRGFSTITGLMAACLVGIVLVREYKPEVLPPELRPQRPVQVVTRVVEKPVEVVREVVREQPRPAHLVAAFQKDEQSPAFLLTVDLDKRMVTVRMVTAERMADKTYQLWMAAQPGQPPSSLGLIGNDEFTVRAALAGYDPAVISSATYGISLEPLGGSPTGQPTGPVMHAKLVQATP